MKNSFRCSFYGRLSSAKFLQIWSLNLIPSLVSKFFFYSKIFIPQFLSHNIYHQIFLSLALITRRQILNFASQNFSPSISVKYFVITFLNFCSLFAHIYSSHSFYPLFFFTNFVVQYLSLIFRPQNSNPKIIYFHKCPIFIPIPALTWLSVPKK